MNLAKVLEISLNNGCSLITGEKLGPSYQELGLEENPFNSFTEIKEIYYCYLDFFIKKMVQAANKCTEALSLLPVPFASFFMGGGETGIDMRDCNSCLGTKYNASGCLIHGLGVTADSLTAIKYFFDTNSKIKFSLNDLITSLKRNYEGFEELRNIYFNPFAFYYLGQDRHLSTGRRHKMYQRIVFSWGFPFVDPVSFVFYNSTLSPFFMGERKSAIS